MLEGGPVPVEFDLDRELSDAEMEDVVLCLPEPPDPGQSAGI